MSTSAAWEDLATRWGFSFDSPHLRRALTHRSGASSPENNERLEFLGDALLGAFAARYLYETLPPPTREDGLSRARVRLIRGETLADAARALGLGDLLIVGPGERKEGRHQHDSLLADAFEALTAAIYLEQGGEAADAFLRSTLSDPLAAIASGPIEPDPKTLLQMRLQALGHGLPAYRTTSESGEGHHHHYIVEAFTTDGRVWGRGEGPNKRTAQAAAAREALSLIASRVL